MRKPYILSLTLIGALFLLVGCSEYQRALKTPDAELKYEVAKELFAEEKYEKAYPLFDALLKLYRGTQKAAEVYYYFAETNFYLEDYLLAAYHYKNFAKTFPNHPKTQTAYYMVGYCYYLQSPRYNLDQTYTYKAINELQLFVNLYPSSDKLMESNELIDELRAKLERKAYERAHLYYHTENYQAAVVSFNSVLDEFPDTEYRQDVLYYRALSSYRLAENSIASKQLQRFIESRTAFREFIDRYPETGLAGNLKDYLTEINTQIKSLKQNTPLES